MECRCGVDCLDTEILALKKMIEDNINDGIHSWFEFRIIRMYIPCIETRCFKPLMSRISCVRTAFLSSLLSAIRKSIVSFVGIFGIGVKWKVRKKRSKKKRKNTHIIMARGKKRLLFNIIQDVQYVKYKHEKKHSVSSFLLNYIYKKEKKEKKRK